jgi:hypothetical protein
MGYLKGFSKPRKTNKGMKYNKIDHGEVRAKNGRSMVDTYETNRLAGKMMRRRVIDEKSKHFIGEKITLNRIIESNEKERTVGGRVIGIYPHFLLLSCGNYRTTVSYTDLVLGAKR